MGWYWVQQSPEGKPPDSGSCVRVHVRACTKLRACFRDAGTVQAGSVARSWASRPHLAGWRDHIWFCSACAGRCSAAGTVPCVWVWDRTDGSNSHQVELNTKLHVDSWDGFRPGPWTTTGTGPLDSWNRVAEGETGPTFSLFHQNIKEVLFWKTPEFSPLAPTRS